MRQSDAVRFGDKPKQLAIAVETPWLALLGHLEAPFISAVQHLVADAAGRVLVREFQGAVAVPLNVDNGDHSLGEDSADSDARLKIFESHRLSGSEECTSARGLSSFAGPGS